MKKSDVAAFFTFVIVFTGVAFFSWYEKPFRYELVVEKELPCSLCSGKKGSCVLFSPDDRHLWSGSESGFLVSYGISSFQGILHDSTYKITSEELYNSPRIISALFISPHLMWLGVRLGQVDGREESGIMEVEIQSGVVGNRRFFEIPATILFHRMAMDPKKEKILFSTTKGLFLWDRKDFFSLARKASWNRKILPHSQSFDHGIWAEETIAGISPSEKTLIFWDSRGKEILKKIFSESPVALTASRDEKKIGVALESGKILLIEVPSGKVLKEISSGHPSKINSLAIYKDWIASADTSDEMEVQYQGKKVLQLSLAHASEPFQFPYDRLAFSSDGAYLAALGSDGFISIWDRTHQKVLRSSTGHRSDYFLGLYDIVATGDGKHAASYGEDGIHLWDLEKGIWEKRLETENLITLKKLYLTPDGKSLILLKNYEGVVSLDLATGKKKHLSTFPQSLMKTLMLSLPPEVVCNSEGKGFLILEDGQIWQFSLSSFSPLAPLRSSGESLYLPGGVARSTDGKTVYLAEKGGAIRKIDLSTGKELLSFRATTSSDPEAIALQEDGTLLLYAPRSFQFQMIQEKELTLKKEWKPIGIHQKALSSKAFYPLPSVEIGCIEENLIYILSKTPSFHALLVVNCETGRIVSVLQNENVFPKFFLSKKIVAACSIPGRKAFLVGNHGGRLSIYKMEER